MTTNAQLNPYMLASDNSPKLLPLLRTNPALASAQDEHGYSLLHAAASWGHVELLRTLVHEFKVDINMTDEDGDTCLFTAESIDIARCLVEDLKIDVTIRNHEGATAAEAIANEDSFPEIAAYLKNLTATGTGNEDGNDTATATAATNPTPGLPSNVAVNYSHVLPEEITDESSEPDMEFRRRIEELVSKDDLETPQGQAQLRELVEDALSTVNAPMDERETKRVAE